jgi:predicted porin
MRKGLLGIGTALGLVTIAHAQSSVTLYGVVDAGFLYQNNVAGKKLFEMSSGNLSGSRWGLRGAEDLGGGLKAVFDLQNGFNVFTGKLGQGGDEFGRTAVVGLSSSQYGTVLLGRQYDSVVDFTGPFLAGNNGMSIYGDHPGDLDNMGNQNRVNSAVKYKSNNYAGLTFGGLYSFGGVAGQFNRNQIWSLGAAYTRGPLSVAAAYLNVKDPNYSFFGNNSTSSTTASNMSISTVYSGYASARTQQVAAAGIGYTIGLATISATYSNTQFKNIGYEAGLPKVGAGGTAKFNNAELNARYQVLPSLMLIAAYDYTKGYGVNNAKYSQGLIAADYVLSKRTDFYINGIIQHASGIDSTGTAAVASLANLSPSSTPRAIAAMFGVRHRF